MSNKKNTQTGKKLSVFFERNERKIVLTLGMVLLAIFSFEAGVLQGAKWRQSPLIINNHYQKKIKEINKNYYKNEGEIIEKHKKNPQSCVFVASKRSKKYHKASCRYVKKIKEDNKICFKNEEDAQKNGYIPAHCLRAGK